MRLYFVHTEKYKHLKKFSNICSHYRNCGKCAKCGLGINSGIHLRNTRLNSLDSIRIVFTFAPLLSTDAGLVDVSYVAYQEPRTDRRLKSLQNTPISPSLDGMRFDIMICEKFKFQFIHTGNSFRFSFGNESINIFFRVRFV